MGPILRIILLQVITLKIFCFVIQQYEILFNVDTAQNLPGIGIHTIIPAALQQIPDVAHKPVQIKWPLAQSLAPLKTLTPTLASLCVVTAPFVKSVTPFPQFYCQQYMKLLDLFSLLFVVLNEDSLKRYSLLV